jgi:hypothetical protein
MSASRRGSTSSHFAEVLASAKFVFLAHRPRVIAQLGTQLAQALFDDRPLHRDSSTKRSSDVERRRQATPTVSALGNQTVRRCVSSPTR